MSLIELMIGMVVALVISLVMFNTLLFAEGQRRMTTGGNDAQQAGTIAAYVLERNLRMGGAGMEQIAGMRGCTLNASLAGAVMVPLPASLAAPFDGLASLSMPISPILIANGGVDSNDTPNSTTPDALILMAGTHPSINTWFQMNGLGTSNAAPVLNSLGLIQGDLLLAMEMDATRSSFGKCTVVEASSTIETSTTATNYRQSTSAQGKQIDLGSSSTTHTPSTGLVVSGTAYGGTSMLADIGKTPLFTIYALGPTSTVAGASELRAYDMLNGTTQSLSDGVVNLQAVYGLSTSAASNIITSWQTPTGAFKLNTLRNGSAASIANIGRIRAIRFGMITRSTNREKSAIAGVPATWTLLGDLGATTGAVTDTRTGNDLLYRYRQYDVIVTLRNH